MVRKRIIIGLLAIVVIGVVAFFVSRPKNESLEHLKGKYVEACSTRLKSDQWRYKWSRLWGEGKPWGTYYRHTRERVVSAERPLIKMNYLEARTFVISRRDPAAVGADIIEAWTVRFPNRTPVLSVLDTNNFALVALRQSEVIARLRTAGDKLLLVAPREDMPVWEELVRKADVP